MDFSVQERTKKKLDWSKSEVPEKLIRRDVLNKLRRRIRLDAYKVQKEDCRIRVCTICGKSNLDLERVDRRGRVEAYLNECSKCNGPALQYRSQPFSVNFFNGDEQDKISDFYRMAECLDCGQLLQPEELEHSIRDLEPHKVGEITIEVLKREIRKNVIDSHHLQYEDHHGREVIIPLCKECHNNEQRGAYPGISPENIYRQDAVIYDEENKLR